MFGTSGGVTYPRRAASSLLVRPRLTTLRHLTRPRAHTPAADMGRAARRTKPRKSNGLHRMDSTKKRTPDYTDIAYRDAVARLRYLLAESYVPSASKYSQAHNKRDESDNETEASFAASDRSRHGHTHPPSHFGSHCHYRPTTYGSKRALHLDSLPKLTHAYSSLTAPPVDGTSSAVPKTEGSSQPPVELMAFIERQEEYIEQLEKESQYCRDELSHLLGKVKEVISENEGLHAKEKAGMLKSVFDSYETADDDDDNELDLEEKLEKKKPAELKKKRLEGPSIVFESRISELEAQLTQSKLDLKKAQEEVELYKKKLSEQHLTPDAPYVSVSNSVRQQLDTLQREKEELSETVSKLQASLAQYREKEADSAHKAKRSLDIVDQAQFEKTQAELEVRRLKEELDRQHEKLCELLQEQARKVQDERTQAERRYAHQVEQLSTELAAQWDNASRLQLDLEKQRRTEQELRRELQQKATIIEELKKELAAKTSGLQSEVMQATVERGSVEQELAASRLAAERAERDARQEVSRLQAEVTALRQRLDRADADLMHSRRENLRLAEQIASLERELNLAKMLRGSSEKAAELSPTKQKSGQRDKDLSSVIMDMDAKHVQNVAELESMIQSQNQVMEKLKDECHLLTQKLEESSLRHKEERMGLKQENAMLTQRLEQLWESCKDMLNGHELQITPTVGIQAVSMNKQMINSMKHNIPNLNSMMTPTKDYNMTQTQQFSTNSKMNNLITTPSSPNMKAKSSMNLGDISNPNMILQDSTKYLQSMTLKDNMKCNRGMNLKDSSSSSNNNNSHLVLDPPCDLRPSDSLNQYLSSRNTNLNMGSMGSSNNNHNIKLNPLDSKDINPSLNLLDDRDFSLPPFNKRNPSNIMVEPLNSLNFTPSSDHLKDRDCHSLGTIVPVTNASPPDDRCTSPLENHLESRSCHSVPTSLLDDKTPPRRPHQQNLISNPNIPVKWNLPALGKRDLNPSKELWSLYPNLWQNPSLIPPHNTDQTLKDISPSTDRQTAVRVTQCIPHHRPGLEPSVPSYPTLHTWRPCEVDTVPLTLEDLATDSDSHDSQSAQLFVFR